MKFYKQHYKQEHKPIYNVLDSLVRMGGICLRVLSQRLGHLGRHLVCFLGVFIALSISGCGNTTLEDAQELQVKGDLASLELAIIKYEESLATALTAVRGIYKAQLFLAIKFAEQGHYLACLERLDAAQAIKMTDERLYYYKGLCYTNLGRAETDPTKRNTLIMQADAAYITGLSYANNNALLYYGQGILYGFVNNRTRDALRLLERSYELEPYDINVLFALGNLYYRDNQIELSRRFYREVMDKTPSQSKKWLKAQKNLALIASQS